MYSGEKLPRLKPCNLSEKIKFASKKNFTSNTFIISFPIFFYFDLNTEPEHLLKNKVTIIWK